ncbi:diguanylate cyclase [Undibacterium sp.]|uniref:sensor domain-containing diguanylate cyclase n=1 Tax=Undibacterium sp. TaxID=1914977 RepID=UPI00374C8A38
MRKFLKQYGLPLWIGLILLAGFAAISITGYVASRDILQQTIAEQSLPAAGDDIYAEIQKELSRTVQASSTVAHDIFVRDWLANGEPDASHLGKYLNEVRQNSSALSAILISDTSHNVYGASAAPRVTSDADPRDRWFQRARQSTSALETSADIDPVSRDLSFTASHRISDANGKFLGAVSISSTSSVLRNLADSYQKRSQRNIYVVDQKGSVMLSASAQAAARQDIQSSPGLGLNGLAATILANKKNVPLQLESSASISGSVLVNARFMPELGWHLLVVQDAGQAAKPLQEVLLINLAIGAAIFAVVLAALLLALRRFHTHMEQSAATDQLTTLLNRQAFGFIFRQSLLDSERSRQPLCVVLIDIDLFKKINDKQGRQVGDHVLKEIAMISKRSLRESDVICRWGGEEFLLLLKNCTLEKATSIAETLRGTIAANDFSRTTSLAKTRLAVTVSMGVAQFKDEDTEDSVFDRADVALRQAKESGRNSVYFSE